MSSRKFLNIFLSVIMIASFLFGGNISAGAQGEDPPPPPPQVDPDPGVVTQAEREAAAAVTLQEGGLNPLMVMEPTIEMAAMTAMPGDAPRYFSHPNYANSPLPTFEGAVISVGSPLADRAWASDTPVPVGQLAPVLVVMGGTLPDGMIQSFQTWNQATSGNSPAPSAGNVFHAYVLRPTGNADEYSVVFDSGQLTVPR